MELTRWIRLGLGVVMIGVAMAASAADNGSKDWPEFRGPTGQGLSTATNVPLRWSSTNGVAWKTKIAGEGWSSPIVVGGRVYLTAASPRADTTGLSLRAIALDEATGKVLWDREVFQTSTSPSQGIHQKNSHASPTPLFADGKLYVHFGPDGTACLSPSGEVLWRQETLKYSPVHGGGASPIRVGDVLFFSCDGASDPFVVALDPATGAIRWKTTRETPAARKFSFSTALALTNGTELQIISPGSGAVCAYHPGTGEELWQVRYGNGYSVVPRPVLAHGLLFLGTGYDRPSFYAVKPGGRGDLTDSNIAWQTARGAPNTPSALVVGDEVYFVSDGGMATCADARTGQVHWNERLDGDVSASPVYAEGKIYFLNEAGDAVVVRAGKKFEILARNSLEERSLASPAVVDNALFIRTSEHLYRLGAALR